MFHRSSSNAPRVPWNKGKLMGQNLQKWYAFSEEQTLSALEKWCECEGFAVERRDRSTV